MRRNSAVMVGRLLYGEGWHTPQLWQSMFHARKQIKLASLWWGMLRAAGNSGSHRHVAARQGVQQPGKGARANVCLRASGSERHEFTPGVAARGRQLWQERSSQRRSLSR